MIWARMPVRVRPKGGRLECRESSPYNPDRVCRRKTMGNGFGDVAVSLPRDGLEFLLREFSPSHTLTAALMRRKSVGGRCSKGHGADPANWQSGKTLDARTDGARAGIAQLAEQLFCKQPVLGSSPSVSSTGRCAVGSAPALGAGGPGFESQRSDHSHAEFPVDLPFFSAGFSCVYRIRKEITP